MIDPSVVLSLLCQEHERNHLLRQALAEAQARIAELEEQAE